MAASTDLSSHRLLDDHGPAGAEAVGAVTSVFEVPVLAGHDEAFLAWAERSAEACERSAGGFLSQTVIRPSESAPGNVYTILLKFRDDARLRAWLEHPAHLTLRKEVAHLTDAEAATSTQSPMLAESMGVVAVTNAVDGSPVQAGHAPPPLWRILIMFCIIVVPVNLSVFCGPMIPWSVSVSLAPTDGGARSAHAFHCSAAAAIGPRCVALQSGCSAEQPAGRHHAVNAVDGMQHDGRWRAKRRGGH